MRRLYVKVQERIKPEMGFSPAKARFLTTNEQWFSIYEWTIPFLPLATTLLFVQIDAVAQ